MMARMELGSAGWVVVRNENAWVVEDLAENEVGVVGEEREEELMTGTVMLAWWFCQILLLSVLS